MALISKQIEKSMAGASWIRRMFEVGIELKQQHGADKVFDFSLGNPDVPPPAEAADALHEIADGLSQPCALGYVPNAGLPAVRSALADYISDEQQVSVPAERIVITCGAAGALNTFFRTVLEAGDEVLCPAPFFAEYRFYVSNYAGVLKTAPALPPSFALDLEALKAELTPKTRVLLLNSPNNPTGEVYSTKELAALAAMLREHSEKIGREVYLVSDEPYRFLVYGDCEVPPILPLYEYAVVAGSFSKSLGMAGERVGYLAVHPDMPDGATLMNGLVLSNRILGYVNAPVIGQKMVQACLGKAQVDASVYDERRKAMAANLDAAGIEYAMPRGAFYFFPKVPEGVEEMDFIRMLQDELILAVPGTGFGYPGYFRLCYCVDLDVIHRAKAAFLRVKKRLNA